MGKLSRIPLPKKTNQKTEIFRTDMRTNKNTDKWWLYDFEVAHELDFTKDGVKLDVTEEFEFEKLCNKETHSFVHAITKWGNRTKKKKISRNDSLFAYT